MALDDTIGSVLVIIYGFKPEDLASLLQAAEESRAAHSQLARHCDPSPRRVAFHLSYYSHDFFNVLKPHAIANYTLLWEIEKTLTAGPSHVSETGSYRILSRWP